VLSSVKFANNKFTTTTTNHVLQPLEMEGHVAAAWTPTLVPSVVSRTTKTLRPAVNFVKIEFAAPYASLDAVFSTHTTVTVTTF
jgi:hypothetical protein